VQFKLEKNLKILYKILFGLELCLSSES